MHPLRLLVVTPLLLGACGISGSGSVLGAIDPSLTSSPLADSDHSREPAGSVGDDDSDDDALVALDAWSLAAREDGAKCREELKAAHFKFQALPDKTQRDKSGCGIPHGVVVVRGPTGIAYEPPITVDCSLARALASVERIVQEEAELHLGARIVRIGNLGAFACRPRNHRKGASLSAHAFGSAVDLSSFQPAKGSAAIVARDYAPPAASLASRSATGRTTAREARHLFLHAVFSRLRHHEADLTYTVGPDKDRAHHDHFHLDRGGWYFWFHPG